MKFIGHLKKQFYYIVLLLLPLGQSAIQAQSWAVPFAYPYGTGMVSAHRAAVTALYTQATWGLCVVYFYDNISREIQDSITLDQTQYMLRLSQSGQQLLSIRQDGKAMLHSTTSNALIDSFEIANANALADVRFLNGDTLLAVAWKATSLLIIDVWHVSTHQLRRSDTLSIAGAQENIRLSRSGELLCFARQDSLVAYTVRSGVQRRMAAIAMPDCQILAYSQDDSLLAVRYSDSVATLRLTAAAILPIGRRQASNIRNMEFSQDNNSVIVETTLFDVALQSPSLFVADQPFYQPENYTGDVLHWKDNRHLWYALYRADGCYSNIPSPQSAGVFFRVFDAISEDVVDELPRGHGYRKIVAQHFSLDNSILASRDEYGITCFWDALTGRYISEQYTLAPATLSHNGKQYYVGTTSMLNVYSVGSNALDWQLSYKLLNEVPSAYPTPNGRYLLLCTTQMALVIALEQRTVERTIEHPMNNISITRTGMLLFTDGDSLFQCNPTNGAISLRSVLKEKNLSQSKLSFSYDGSRLLSYRLLKKIHEYAGGSQYMGRVYDVASGMMLYQDSSWYDISAMHLSHNGRYIFSSSAARDPILMKDMFSYKATQLSDGKTFCAFNGSFTTEGSGTVPIYTIQPSADSRLVAFRWNCNTTHGVFAACDERIPTAVEEGNSDLAPYNSSFSPHPAEAGTRWCFEIADSHPTQALLKIYSFQGIVATSQDYTLNEEAQQCVHLNTENLPSGIYKVEIQCGSYVIRGSFVVLH